VPVPEEIYVLTGIDGVPLIAHTTEQGADEDMSTWGPQAQQRMNVKCIRLVDDDG
jgi:hypothetical protein